MKKTDIALVILIAAISVIGAYWLGNLFLADPAESVVVVPYIEEVSATVTQPDEETFNAQALNPTVEVYVGDCSGTQVWDEGTKSCRDAESDGGAEGVDGGEESGATTEGEEQRSASAGE